MNLLAAVILAGLPGIVKTGSFDVSQSFSTSGAALSALLLTTGRPKSFCDGYSNNVRIDKVLNQVLTSMPNL